MKFETRQATADLIIVGAGFPGICAAIQAARMGVHVALINDRGVLGGNSSCEIGVVVNGANDCAPINLNSREGGLPSEMLLEFKYRSPEMNPYIWDTVLIDFVAREKNIDVYLNTCIDEVELDEKDGIVQASGTQNSTEIRWTFSGTHFVDATGDGTLGFLAGADYMLGREAKSDFNERFAPDVADSYVLPSTLFWRAENTGHPVRYVAPDFALDISKTDILKHRVIPHDSFHRFQWYYEIGGDYDHVKDREQIIAEHKALAYGIWDYVKNSGEYPEAENYDLTFMGLIPGTREYRRLTGEYVLTENDLEQQAEFDDAVGHGGWNIDLHANYGIFDSDIINRHIFLKGIYNIPYRSGYSKNIPNLFMAGRCMSATHAALGSTRVIATLATLGQAVGMAAGLCKKYDASPDAVYREHRQELQQALLAADQLIIGLENQDEDDLARSATVSATSTAPLALPSLMPSGVTTGTRQELTTYVGKKLKKASSSQYVRLENSFGLTIPVTERLDAVRVKVRAQKATRLTYRLSCPEKKENYGPGRLLHESSIELAASTMFEWIELPVNVEVEGFYAFFELEENEDVEVAIAGFPLPTTQMFQREVNESANLWDVEQLDMLPHIWTRRTDCICFTTVPEQPVYGAENVVNGYNRAHGLPNMWLSEMNDAQPELTLSWDSPVTLNSVQITFAIDTTLRIYRDVPMPVMPLIAQDFVLEAHVGGQKQTLAVVQDNFRKVCRLSFDAVTADRISFRFDRSYTGQVGVYEVRCYEEKL